MEDAVVVLVGQALVFIGILINMAVALHNTNKLSANSAKLAELHIMVNSRLDKLIVTEKGISYAEGVIKGTDTERLNPLEPKT